MLSSGAGSALEFARVSRMFLNLPRTRRNDNNIEMRLWRCAGCVAQRSVDRVLFAVSTARAASCVCLVRRRLRFHNDAARAKTNGWRTVLFDNSRRDRPRPFNSTNGYG